MQQRSSKFRQGFTLVELLVVIGIIVILIGLLVPVLSKTMRQGTRVRIGSDLNAIQTALDAYKGDFGDYPRIAYTGSTPLNGTGSGAELLGKSLLGLGGEKAGMFSATVAYYPGQVVSTTGSIQFACLKPCTGVTPAANSDSWVTVISPASTSDSTFQTGGGFDGADGPGFRVRNGGYGQVYGPYLQVDKFKTRGLELLDYVGNPILYFPANPAKPNPAVKLTSPSTPATVLPAAPGNALLSVPTGVIAAQAPSGATVPVASVSLYNYSDNDTAAVQGSDSSIAHAFPGATGTGSLGMSVMLSMLGDYALSGFSDAANGDSDFAPRPYLLWSAGPDGVFGPKEANPDPTNFVSSLTAIQRKTAVGKCDDVTNFNLGQ